MEKLIYALRDTDRDALLDKLAPQLCGHSAGPVRINLQDAEVAAGAGLIQDRGQPLPDAVVQCWLPTANPLFRREVDAMINDHCAACQGWLVAESTIIANEAHPPQAGKRTAGFAQMAFLTLPKDMAWTDWRAVWRDYHTQVAIETQSNFEYVQNLVIEPLTADAPPFVAIVEECFPIEALTDPLVFFDARGRDGEGDQEKFERNLAIMMESCGRFIEPGTIDVFPSSQFCFGN